MITLIIDGNNLLRKLVGLLDSDRSLLDPAFDHNLGNNFDWVDTLLTQSFCSMISRMSRFQQFSAVFLAMDTKNNWRKEIYADYKGKRKNNENLPWEYIFEQYEKIALNIESSFKRLKVYRGAGLEGDDIIALLIENLNKKGHSCIIASEDGDFKQLVKIGWGEPKWINMLWKEYIKVSHKFVVPVNTGGFVRILSDGNDLFNMGTDNSVLRACINNIMTNYAIEEIEYKEFFFKKILTGDNGDNVPSIYKKTQKLKTGDTREVGIGESSAEKIWKHYSSNFLNDDIDYMNENWIEPMIESVKSVMKLTNIDEDKLKENIKFNVQLMHLESSRIPKKYRDNILL